MSRALAAGIAVFVIGGCHAHAAKPRLYEMSFAINVTGRPGPDSIPSYRRVIPKVVRHCGAEFLAFDDTVSDGGEGAFFQVGGEPGTVTACVKRSFPETNIMSVERTTEVEKYLKAAAKHCGGTTGDKWGCAFSAIVPGRLILGG
jgi:hypothetical protein